MLDERIAPFDAEFAAESKQNGPVRRLTNIPGIRALNATAVVAAVGDAQTFSRGRNLAARLGLVPSAGYDRRQTADYAADPSWRNQIAIERAKNIVSDDPKIGLTARGGKI